MSDHGLIPPHGGTLVNLVASDARREELESTAANLTRIHLPDREQCDVEQLAFGGVRLPARGLDEMLADHWRWLSQHPDGYADTDTDATT
ncbi:MAG: hypothetical protein IH986_13270 [Planctomycetes bacterium]|nr:hypothetical protein [Planctomycetota bacterium]